MNMGMARCKKRYQRQLYIGWLLPAVARNVNVLFQCLWPEMAALRVEKRFFGLDRWLQYQSAVVLCKHGVQIDKDALGTPTTRAEKGLHPTGMPKRRRLDVAPPTPVPQRNRESHTLVDVREKPKALPKPGSYKNNRPTAWYSDGGHCCACQKLAERLGYMVNIYEGERNRKPVWKRHMPTVMPAHWTHVNGDARVPKRSTACLECSKRLRRPVWLCPECHKSHEIWDHEMAKPASHRVTVG